MTSSYGYQRPLSNEEELYLQNQALRAELQRREGEKEGGFIDTLGKTALAAGAVAGAALAGRRLAPGRTTSATVDLSKFGEKVADVRLAAAARIAPKEVVPASRPAPTTSAERLQQIEEVTRQARAERPQGIRQVDLRGQRTDLPTARTPGTFQEFSREASGAAAAERLAQDPELLSLVKAQAAEELSEARSFQAKAQAEYRNLLSEKADEAIGALRKEANTVQAAAETDFGPQSFLQSEGYVAADNLVDQHQARSLGRIDQFANAANAAEDQQTGRVKMALQRNEDENLAAIEMAEDAVDAQIAKATQDNPAVASVSEVDAAINQVASSRPDGMPVDQAEGTTSAQRFLQQERDEIASQLGEQGLPVSPSRVEMELANRVSGTEAWKYGPKYTQRKQALQLGATYDPQLFDNLKTKTVTIAGEQVPVSSLKEPVAMKDTALRLQERAEQKRDWLGSVRLEEQKNKVRLDKVNKQITELEAYKGEVADFVRSGRANPQQKQTGLQRLADLSLDLDRLDTQRSELNNRVFIGEKRIAGARRAVEEGISNLELPQKLKSGIEEGQRIFFEVDPKTGQPIPGTQELRSEKYAIDLEPKTGGGRQVVEFDPEGQSGQVKDIYGVRLASDFPDDPEVRPSKPGPSRTPLTQEVTPERLESFDVSRQLRQLQTSGRPEEAQAFLDKIMKQRGISGTSGSFSSLR